VAFAAALVLLVLLGNHCPTKSREFTAVEIGVTSRAEVVELFGPPIRSSSRTLRSEKAQRPGLRNKQNELDRQVTFEYWWYDGDHVIEIEFDEEGTVVSKNGPVYEGPRSPIRRWIRDTGRWIRTNLN
jgi:hypothetical protein